MVSELKPCPFCGSSAKLEVTICDSVVRCTICSCRVLLKNPRIGNCRDTVVLAWNTRTPDPEALEAAFRLGLEVAAGVAESAELPDGYQWGRDAMEQFDFGKERAAAAILAIDPAQHLSKPCSCGSVLGYNHAGICKHCGADPAQHLGRE